jgi:hypothetical protein
MSIVYPLMAMSRAHLKPNALPQVRFGKPAKPPLIWSVPEHVKPFSKEKHPGLVSSIVGFLLFGLKRLGHWAKKRDISPVVISVKSNSDKGTDSLAMIEEKIKNLENQKKEVEAAQKEIADNCLKAETKLKALETEMQQKSVAVVTALQAYNAGKDEAKKLEVVQKRREEIAAKEAYQAQKEKVSQMSNFATVMEIKAQKRLENLDKEKARLLRVLQQADSDKMMKRMKVLANKLEGVETNLLENGRLEQTVEGLEQDYFKDKAALIPSSQAQAEAEFEKKITDYECNALLTQTQKEHGFAVQTATAT